MGWYETVCDAVFDALCAAFGMNPETNAALERFIQAYLPNSARPQAARTTDLCYYSVSEDNTDTAYGYQMIQYEDSKATIKETIPFSVQLVFYGPNADNDAHKFWRLFQFDSGYDSPRSVLRRARIVPNGAVPRPTSLFETEGAYQRRRCDIRLSLAYLDIETRTIATISKAPDLNVSTNT